WLAILCASFVSTSLVFGQTVSNGASFPVSISPGAGVPASTLTFATPAPTAGISQAGLAGISDHAPIQQGVQSTLVPSPMVYTSGPATVFYAGSPSVNSADRKSVV